MRSWNEYKTIILICMHNILWLSKENKFNKSTEFGSRRLSTYFASISSSRFSDSSVAYETFDCSTEISGHKAVQ